MCVHVCERVPACMGTVVVVNQMVRPSLIQNVPSLREDKKGRKLAKEKNISGRGHSQGKVLTQECAWCNGVTARKLLKGTEAE